MGRVGNGLNDLAEFLETEGIQKQRENDGNREAGGERVNAQDKGVTNRDPCIGGAKKACEIGKPNPFTVEHAELDLVIAEGDLNAVNRPVVVDQRDDHSRQAEQEKIPVSAHAFQKGLSMLSRGEGRR